ncbi:MAG: IS1595 family transposase [Candidatus Dormiibacterota bacterium]
MELTVISIAERIPTEADAYKFLEELRWGSGQPTCPHCACIDDHYFLTAKGGAARKTRTGTMSQRRVWECRACHQQFSVLTGTIMHGTKIPVRTWVFVIFELCSSKNGVAAREIERKYHLTPKTAWYLLHRIREAMKPGQPLARITGRVVADETWIGGAPANRHGQRDRQPRPGATDKTPVMSLVSRETGEVRSQVIPNTGRKTLRKVLKANTEPRTTFLHTDSAPPYRVIGHAFAGHTFVNHVAGEYVRNGAGTNQAENYFSQLKRSIDGTHHHVSREHLGRYLAEFDFRHSTHTETDSQRMETLMGRVGGRRLRYTEAR